MKAIVTLLTCDPDGQPAGVSEFVLYEPDEARFLQRAKGLFAMATGPFTPLYAKILACGKRSELDAGRDAPEVVAVRLWETYRTLCPDCP